MYVYNHIIHYYSYTHRYHIYPTYAVHIVLYCERKGVVEHILHIGNVQAAGCHICVNTRVEWRVWKKDREGYYIGN